MRALFDFRHTRVSLGRPLSSYGKVRLAWGSLIRGRRFQCRRERVRQLEYLNVGCGPRLHPALINLDREWCPGLDLCWDIRRPVPLPSASLRGIFTEHCLEHLTFAEGRAVLGEFRRLLRAGGTARIVVPDCELYLDLYHRHRRGEPVRFPGPADSGTAMMAVSRVFQEHGHVAAYDAATLRVMLTEAGFLQVVPASFGSGRDPALLIDSAERAAESLYMEAF
jgi:predicted SAM-dependent methyltransferase